MYAIVEIAGQQFKVAKDQKVFVHRLQEEEGTNVSFDKVLLLDNEGKITIGAPAIKGAEVTAKILSHLKGDKVIVFKKKRRKGYKKKNGHRQSFTEIQVEEILASGAKKKTETKVVTPEKAGAKAKATIPTKAVIPAKAGTGTKSEEKVVSTDLTAMTVAQLKALAKEKGIKGYTSLKKAELIEALNK